MAIKTYLTKERYWALLLLWMEGGSFEVPIETKIKSIDKETFLPDTNNGRPRWQRAKYYTEGGCAWPDRWVFEVS